MLTIFQPACQGTESRERGIHSIHPPRRAHREGDSQSRSQVHKCQVAAVMGAAEDRDRGTLNVKWKEVGWQQRGGNQRKRHRKLKGSSEGLQEGHLSALGGPTGSGGFTEKGNQGL